MQGALPVEAVLNISDQGQVIRCQLPTSAPSREAIACHARRNMIEFVSAADRKPVAIATIPAKLTNVILVFVAMPPASKSMPWKVFVIDDSYKGFPDGGAFVANFHSQDIRFVIGERKIMLPPGGAHGFGRPVERDAFNMSPVVFLFQQGEKWITASESMLRFTPGLRHLIFAYLDPASGRPSLASYSDIKSLASPGTSK